MGEEEAAAVGGVERRMERRDGRRKEGLRETALRLRGEGWLWTENKGMVVAVSM